MDYPNWIIATMTPTGRHCEIAEYFNHEEEIINPVKCNSNHRVTISAPESEPELLYAFK